jgi:excisionase family DNA binding protein
LKNYLTTSEAAEYTGISASKLAKLRHQGSGAEYIRIGCSKTKAVIRYKKSDLDHWLENNKIQTIGGV